MGEILIGTVLPFAGQVNPVNGSANTAWANLPCAPAQPSVAKQSQDAPVLHIESDGWMLCDGRYLSAAAYPELYAVIGTLYGSRTAGSDTEFAIPDYRGLFLRGFDAGSGLDPDAASRTAPQGGHLDNVVGSLQCDSFQSHTHHYNVTQPAGVATQGQAASTTVTSAATTEPDKPARVSSETRPKNVAINYIVKFR